MGPSTVKVMKKYENKIKNVIIVPLGFTSDHLETLFELDIELMHEFKPKY
ncbi:MAG: ferrochelatase [bacterium]